MGVGVRGGGQWEGHEGAEGGQGGEGGKPGEEGGGVLEQSAGLVKSTGATTTTGRTVAQRPRKGRRSREEGLLGIVLGDSLNVPFLGWVGGGGGGGERGRGLRRYSIA